MEVIGAIPLSEPGVTVDRTPKTIVEAAEQFEQVLLRELVGVMTKQLFDSSLLGDDAPASSSSYQDMQRDVVTEQLAKQLSESGQIGIARVLIEQYERAHAANAQPPPNSPSITGTPIDK